MKKLKSILLAFVFICFGWVHAKGDGVTEIRDTLCIASEAAELTITYNPSSISVTVKDINGTGENYYYKTGASDKKHIKSSSITVQRDVTGVLIIERGGEYVDISYKGRDAEVTNLVYTIPDYENRYVKSYTGWNGDDFGLSLGRKGKSEWSLISNGLGMGWVTPVNSSPVFSTAMGRSMEWSWLSVLGVKWSYGVHSLETGLGIYWRNYSLADGRHLEKNEDGSLSIETFPQNVEKGKSRLQLFSLELPFLYTFRFGHRKYFALTGGGVMNFNTDANIKTQYKEGDRSYSVKTGSLHQNPVTVDALAVIHYRALGLYARYSPMHIMKSRTGLTFSSFSTGIIFLF